MLLHPFKLQIFKNMIGGGQGLQQSDLHGGLETNNGCLLHNIFCSYQHN